MLEREERGEVVLLRPKGWLIDRDELYELEDALEKLFASGNQHVVVNLGDVRHLSSFALHVIVSMNMAYARRGGRLRLCRLDVHVQNILTVTKLGLVLHTYRTEQEAVNACAT